MDVNETLLPGVGIRYEFVTATGDRMGLVTHRDGHVDVLAYDSGDPDECRQVMTLTLSEADTLAELLGAPRMVEKFAELTREIPGLISEQMRVPDASRFVERPLGDTRARTLTGCSIVAIVRHDDVVASPTPQEVLRAMDVLVVIGTSEGISQLRTLIEAPAPA